MSWSITKYVMEYIEFLEIQLHFNYSLYIATNAQYITETENKYSSIFK